VGKRVGTSDGLVVGYKVGTSEGRVVGPVVGRTLGTTVGGSVGRVDGSSVGKSDGVVVGYRVGTCHEGWDESKRQHNLRPQINIQSSLSRCPQGCHDMRSPTCVGKTVGSRVGTVVG
jgi:hypothetical protein